MKTTITAIALVALLLSGCGGKSDSQKKADAQATAAAAAKAKAKKVAAKDTALEKACETSLGDFEKSMTTLNSRLSVGLSQNDFNTALGDAKALYDQIDFDSLTDPYCLKGVGAPLEAAYNNYIKSNTIWADCINDYNCNVKTTADPKMQKLWSKAGLQIETAKTTLSSYHPSQDLQ